MRIFRIYIVTVDIIIIISFVHGGSIGSEKCTENDSRKLYDGCSLDYKHMALWCDLTNFACIPEPDEIKSLAPCDRAIYLFMNNSCLDHIDPAILQKYTSLRWVDFSDNFLTSIPRNSFSKATKLRHLDASMNNISDFSLESFPIHNRLRNLKLSKNKISHLVPGTFERMVELKTINLDGNQITTFSVGWFPKRSRLSVLSVRNNFLSSGFEPNPGQFENLKVIHLGGNQIQSLSRRNFSHLAELHEVYLNDNQISTIEGEAFDEATQLTTINLKNNNLEHLPRGLFNKLCSLRELVLTGNQLATLHPDWFGNALRHSMRTATPMRLSLMQNKWSCDCRMSAYWDFLQGLESESSEDAALMDVECYYPEEFHGRKLKSMSKKQLLSSGSCSGFIEEKPISIPKKRKRDAPKSFFSDDDLKSVIEDNMIDYAQIADECVEVVPKALKGEAKDHIVTSEFDEVNSDMKTTSEDDDDDKEDLTSSNAAVIIICSVVASLVLVALVAAAFLRQKFNHRGEEETKKEKQNKLMSRNDEVFEV